MLELECIKVILEKEIERRLKGEILTIVDGIGLSASSQDKVKNLISASIRRNIQYANQLVKEIMEVSNGERSYNG